MLATVSLSLSLACNNDDGGSTGEASLTGSSTGGASGTTGSSEPATGSTGDAPTTGADASTGDASTGQASTATTTGATAETATTAMTGDGTTTAEGTTEVATTEPAPTSGPGVLPGEDGMDAFCRRYVECGGTYYAGEQECLDATYDYWGMCPSRKAALDEFGACMSELECTDWSPDAYNPNSTPCADQWGEVQSSDPC